MLAGTVYFYKNNEVVQKMDMEDYDDLSKDEFIAEVKKLKADKVMLRAYSNNHQRKPYKEILYEEPE